MGIMEQSEILKTAKEYEDALKAMKPNIIRDTLLEKPFEDEDIQKGMNVVSLTYDRARDPKYKELMTVKSPLTGKTINRFNHIPRTQEDLSQKLMMINMIRINLMIL